MDQQQINPNDYDIDDSASQISFNTEKLDNEKKQSEMITKLKKAFLKLKQQYNQKVLELENTQKHCKELESIIENQLSEEKKQIQKDEIKKINAIVSVDSVNWVCLRSNEGTEWIRQESNQNLWTDLEQPQILDYNEILKKIVNDEKNKKNYENDLQNVIKQYDSRVSRLQTLYDKSEKQCQILTDANQEFIKQIEQNKDEIQSICVKIVDESESIVQNCMLYLSDENDESTKTDCMKKMKNMLIAIQQMNFEYQYTDINIIKDHILLLHQTLFDTLKRLNRADQELNQQEKQWRLKCDNLIADKEQEQKQKMEILDSGRKKIKELESVMQKLQDEQFKTNKEKDIKLEFLNKELKKNVNTQYIKNILIKFFKSDFSVQEKTIPVIATVLQFTQEEQQLVEQAWNAKQFGSMASLGNILSQGISNFKL